MQRGTVVDGLNWEKSQRDAEKKRASEEGRQQVSGEGA
jgi:hypothetical protein